MASQTSPAAPRLETPWLTALISQTGVEPVKLCEHLPREFGNHPAFQESGLYLFPNALNPAYTAQLTQELTPMFGDIAKASDATKSTKVAQHASFQAVSSNRCSCKYNYTGAARQLLYHRGDVASWLQPKSVTTFLDDIFHTFESFAKEPCPMIRTTCDSSPASAGQALKPREFNLVVVNEYNYNQKSISHIPWHDDKMDQSARNETDL